MIMHKAAEEFYRFLEEVTEEGIDERNIELAYMAVVGYEKTLKACVLEEEMEGGHSREGNSNRGGYSSRRYSREGGASYDEGGDSYRRDRMGRYSRDDGKKQLKEQVEMMMRQAGSPQEKEMAHKFIELLEKS